MRASVARVLCITAVFACATALAACGGSSEASDDSSSATANAAAKRFPAGSAMAKLAEAGKLRIGIKKDQPGIGFQEPGADQPTGFDVEVAKLVADKLGVTPDHIEWIEAVTKNREPFLQNGDVDLVLASYSITPERRQVVGQAGPYYVTGQQLLVRKDDSSIGGPDDIGGKKVCTVTGSTSIKTIEEQYQAHPVAFATYSECVQQLLNDQVDAVTTDGAILLGYAAEQPDKLAVVGKPFSEERYGIGYPKDAAGMCEFLDDTLKQAQADGSWKAAFDRTLGKAGVPAPQPPALDACPS